MTGAMRALAVLALLLLGGCTEADYRWRERLTLVFDTPRGEVAVSGVTEAYVGFYSYPVIGSGNELSGWRNGEAMPIDLGDGGKVYALLKSFGFAAAIYEDLCYLRTCGPLFTAPNPPEPRVLLPAPGISSVILQRLVWLSDPADPASLEMLDPLNLDRSLGPGYRLREIRFAFAPGEELTTGLVEQLSWLGPGPEPHQQVLTAKGPGETVTHLFSYDWIKFRE